MKRYPLTCGLLCAIGLALSQVACSSQAPASPKAPPHHARPPAKSPDAPGRAYWPKTSIAQRDFAADVLSMDRKTRPWKLWMISLSGAGGKPEAMEFFTGERVSDIHVQLPPGTLPCWRQLSYSFTDTTGHPRSSERTAQGWCIDAGHPSPYAGTQRGEVGHDVWLGGYLFKTIWVSKKGGGEVSQDIFPDPAAYFGKQPTCQSKIYVARTEGSTVWPEAEVDFVPRVRILAGHDAQKQCWSTQPLQVMDLEDNTFVITTGNRVFRINADNLEPAGSAPDLKIIDVKEE